MRKMEFKLQELIPTPIDTHQYDENLAEIAECLYDYFHKLDLKNIPTGPELQDQGQHQEVRYE